MNTFSFKVHLKMPNWIALWKKCRNFQVEIYQHIFNFLLLLLKGMWTCFYKSSSYIKQFLL